MDLLSGLTMRMRITASGLEATPVTRVIVCQLTTDTSSPQWTEIMTSPLNVAPVLLLTVEDGGSTGENLTTLVQSLWPLLLFSFSSCFESNLNGEYFSNPQSNGYYRGIIWELWLGDYSLKETRMMIRRRRDP